MIKKIISLFIVFSVISIVAISQYSWHNLPTTILPSFKKDTINIMKFGAKPDGIYLNTKHINDAIESCSNKGGGVVLVPSGVFLTGPIVLKSNVNLYISNAAILLFTNDFNQYHLVETNWEGSKQMRNESPISGNNLTNVAITGKGIIDGNGDAWRMVGKDKLTESDWKKKVASGGLVSADGKLWYPSEKTKKAFEGKLNGVVEINKNNEYFESIKDFLRPNLLVLNGCKKVLLEGVTFQYSPAWNLHTLLCEDLTIKNINVKTQEYAQNGDGLDIESCKNVLIDGCTFDVGDDGICIKSGRDEEGRKRGVPTENVLVQNSTVYHAHGGFVIGSEMSGGAKNIFVQDCKFIGTDKGLRFKTARGRGGIVENIYCRNIYMKNIVQEAIYFDMYYFTKPPKVGEKIKAPVVTEATPQFKNFYIDNIVCIGAEKGVFIRGLPEMSIKNINLSNLVLKTNKAVEIFEADKVNIGNITLEVENTNPVVYIENSTRVFFDKFILNNNTADLTLNISGDKTKEIKFSNAVISMAKAKSKVAFVNGASPSSVEIK